MTEVSTGRNGDERKIKCVVWDLDDTLWEGVLLEGGASALRAQVEHVVRELDSRGILQSIASKNEHGVATERLRAFGLEEFFLYPQINWNSKASSIAAIARSINIGLDAVAFVDDQPFEREEVAFSLPDVLCLDAGELGGLLDRPELTPRFLTDDARNRRLTYLLDSQRQRAEEEFVGTKEEFLATLGMSFTLAPAAEEDLRRAEELTLRTNQLNTTGYTYSYDELDHFRQSDGHLLLVASLEDKYGSYGKIGLALVECGAEFWEVKLLLMSCRVMSRGVGMIMVNHVMARAQRAGARLRAEFVSNGRNRMMYVTYKFAGFKEIEKRGDLSILEHDLAQIPPFPDYIEVRILD